MSLPYDDNTDFITFTIKLSEKHTVYTKISYDFELWLTSIGGFSRTIMAFFTIVGGLIS